MPAVTAWIRSSASSREPDKPARADGQRRRRAQRRRRLHRPLVAGRGERRRDSHDGARRRGLRDGEPDARGAPGGDRRRRRGDRNRPLRLPEPDQQRARVPGRVSRRTRRARVDDQRRDGARGCACDRGRRGRRASRPRLRHPQRLQPGRRNGSRECGRRALRSRPELPERKGGRDESQGRHDEETY